MKRHIQKALEAESVRFAAVGVVNTLIDFAILNILVSGAGLDRIPANIFSASVAMIFSFYANKNLVFKSATQNQKREVLLFLVGTLFGLYILQSFTIYVLTGLWLWPVHAAVSLAHGVGLGADVSDEFIITNTAKIGATIVSLIWNFIYYKKVVFKGE